MAVAVIPKASNPLLSKPEKLDDVDVLPPKLPKSENDDCIGAAVVVVVAGMMLVVVVCFSPNASNPAWNESKELSILSNPPNPVSWSPNPDWFVSVKLPKPESLVEPNPVVLRLLVFVLLEVLKELFESWNPNPASLSLKPALKLISWSTITAGFGVWIGVGVATEAGLVAWIEIWVAIKRVIRSSSSCKFWFSIFKFSN